MIYLFDIDGVLTDTGYNINSGFKQWFIDWSMGKKYALVTGSTLERTYEQIGHEITDGAMLVANCMGNSIFQEGRSVTLNEFEFTAEEEKWLMDKVEESSFHIRAGQHIASRPGSFNFSIVGRNATPEQREEYKLYDQEHKERISIAKEFRKRFSRFDVFIGGDISVDICLRGAHKGQVFHLLATFLDGTESLSFFGDKMGKWGIDEPLAELMSSQPKCYSFEINEGYAETKHFLKNIYEYVEHMDMLESQET